MIRKQQPNRSITTGDQGGSERAFLFKLSPSGVLQFGKHCGKGLGQVPLSYLQWLRNNDILDGERDAAQALARELRKRNSDPEAKPTVEVISAMGFILIGEFENMSASKLTQLQLEELRTTPNLSERSMQRLKGQLTKLQERNRRKNISQK